MKEKMPLILKNLCISIRPEKLQNKLVLLIVGLSILQIGVIGIFSSNMIATILEEQIGFRALRVSQTVSLIPAIRDAIKVADPLQHIQPLAEEIRKTTGAQFVVVGDHEGKRYSHPVKERLGKYMVGGDNPRALENGESYVSKAIGTLGPSIRGKVPIFDQQGKVTGIVSVGYLIENVNSTVDQYQQRMLLYVGSTIIIGVLLAILIAKGFKKAIFNLEPDEIASLFQERNAILEALHEGIIAINVQENVTMINQAAFQNIELPPDPAAIGKHIFEILPQSEMLNVLKSGKQQLDQEFIVNEEELIVNRIPIFIDGKVSGVVSSFRKKNEIDRLVKKLSQVEEYSEMLRAQTHEYSNKLYTISGLIQLGAYAKALDLISDETSGYQELIQFLVSAIPDPLISGCLLGKYNRAQELKIQFVIDRESSLSVIPEEINREKIVTILGNLIENAFDAVLAKKDPEGTVHLSMTDLGNDLIFEIEDTGCGINAQNTDQIYEKGYTTKSGQNRGFGLFLTEKAIQYLNGHIIMTSKSAQGTTFSVFIPKNGKADHGKHTSIDHRR